MRYDGFIMRIRRGESLSLFADTWYFIYFVYIIMLLKLHCLSSSSIYLAATIIKCILINWNNFSNSVLAKHA